MIQPLNLPPRVKMKMIVNHHASKMIPKSKCHVQSPTNNFVCVLSVSIYTQSSSKKIGACDSWRSSPWKCFPSSSPRFELCILLLATKLTTRGAKRVAQYKNESPIFGTKVIKNEWLPVLLCAWLLRCSLSFYIPFEAAKCIIHHHLRSLGHRLQGLKFLFERRQLVLAIVTCPARLENITIPMFSCKFTASALKNYLGKFPNLEGFQTWKLQNPRHNGHSLQGRMLQGSGSFWTQSLRSWDDLGASPASLSFFLAYSSWLES